MSKGLSKKEFKAAQAKYDNHMASPKEGVAPPPMPVKMKEPKKDKRDRKAGKALRKAQKQAGLMGQQVVTAQNPQTGQPMFGFTQVPFPMPNMMNWPMNGTIKFGQ